MDKKRKKQYYANAAKKAKFGGPRKLSENMRGFLITVNNRFVFGCLGKIRGGTYLFRLRPYQKISDPDRTLKG
jgi:hypothetical protein